VRKRSEAVAASASSQRIHYAESEKAKIHDRQDTKTSVLAKVDAAVANLFVGVDTRSWKMEEAGVAEGSFDFDGAVQGNRADEDSG
jgi:hypothetical protein